MKGFEFSVNSKSSRIVEEYAKQYGTDIDSALRKFLLSKTYEILSDSDTGLYLEMFEYVYDMFLEEMNGVII